MVIGPHDIGSTLYALREGNVVSVNFERNTIGVNFAGSSQSLTPTQVRIPASWRGPKGEISMGYPMTGTTVYCALSQGGHYVVVGYKAPNTDGSRDGDGTNRISLSKLKKPGVWGTLISNDISIIADPERGVVEGGSRQFTQSDPIIGIFSTRYDNTLEFTQAHRSVTGPIIRDVRPDSTRDTAFSALTDHGYNKGKKKIGLDPSANVGKFPKRNPGFTESRQIYYEFENSYNFTTDHNEINLYDGQDPDKTSSFRRYDSRLDTLSLSQDVPNFLLETTIGTVVDIYGNILDINRTKLPSGEIDSLKLNKSEIDTSSVFKKLREQNRKSIAYHAELNAKKDGFDQPDYDDDSDYVRARSRLFIDVDKEGQFKINIPASSETGNVPVLARYDNFSSLKGAETDSDRGAFIKNITDNTDIKLVGYGYAVTQLVSNDPDLKAYAAPIDRVTSKPIGLGTCFHSFDDALFLHKVANPIIGYPSSNINKIPPIGNLVSKEVIVSGPGANAGGRSGMITLDGFAAISIGANTVDRQSLWVDTAGSATFMFGRDKYQRSLCMQLDGDMLVQVGGTSVPDDSRFTDATDTGSRDGVVDIRVLTGNQVTVVRIDNTGVKVHTPGNLELVSQGNMLIKSVTGDLAFDAETIYFYSSQPNGARMLNRGMPTLG